MWLNQTTQLVGNEGQHTVLWINDYDKNPDRCLSKNSKHNLVENIHKSSESLRAMRFRRGPDHNPADRRRSVSQWWFVDGWSTWSPAPISSSSRFTCTPLAMFGDCCSMATSRFIVLKSKPIWLGMGIVEEWNISNKQNEDQPEIFYSLFLNHIVRRIDGL